MSEEMMRLAAEIERETPAVAVVWSEEEQRKYREWFASLSPEEQARQRDGMIAT